MKKLGFLSLAAIAALLFSLAFPAAAAVPKAPVPAVPALALPPQEAAHPQIRDALEAMRNAKHHLEAGSHDFGGHRVKAIQHLDAAIHEAEICMSMK